MRRWLWSAAVLMGMAVSAAQAEYLVIRVYVGGRDGAASAPAQPGDEGDGGRPGGFGPGAPGGGFGPGAAGGGFGPGAAGGGFGPGAPGGGFGPGAAGGVGGGPKGPGGAGGPMGGFGPGAAGGPMGGFGPGAAGGPMGGFGPGAAGGPMGGFGPGAAGGPMGGFGPGGPMGGFGPGGPMGGFGPGGFGGAAGLASGVSFDTFESYVIVAVEIDKSPIMHEQFRVNQYKHAWGKTAYYNDGTAIITSYVDYKSPSRKFIEMKKKLADKKDKTAGEYITLANFALGHGLVSECAQVLEDVLKTTPANADERTQAILNAYRKVRDDLAKPVTGSGAVDEWKSRLGATYSAAPSKEGHYVIFYNDPSKDTPAEVIRRADMLEKNMRAYYMWFALQGKALPVPEERLMAIMVPDAVVFKQQRTALATSPSVSDGFFSARDNVAVFSTQRLDEAYQIFAKTLQSSVWQRGWSRGPLLAGKDVPKELKKERNWRDEFRRAQTLALVDKALEHEAELAAVTHEGTRQLAIATNLYPKAVAAPEWIQFGFASLFDTPKGPYPGAIGTAKTAFWPVYGGANWAYIRPFRIWAASTDSLTKLDEPAMALKRTMTDYYFQNARKEIKDEIASDLTEAERKKREKEISRAKEEQLRARAQAWALTYYLARFKMDGLLAYFDELSKLPRDLELDDATMTMAFARAFKLTTADGSAVDETKLTSMANDWFEQIKRVELPGPDFDLGRRQDRQGSNPAGGPGGFGPGGPGGFGPGGPGGPGGGPPGPGGPGGGLGRPGG